MRLVLALLLVACACYVQGESCHNVGDCHTTTCAMTNMHVHVQCVNKHCTCVEDPVACLSSIDCHVGRCIDHDGHPTSWHCVDGYCRCLRLF